MLQLNLLNLRRLLMLFLFGLFATQISAQLIVDPGGSTDDIIESIVGPGVTYSNVSITCDDNGYGLFSGGDSTPIGIENGVILTSGAASDAIGPNNSPSQTVNTGIPGDSDLDDLISPLSTNDACILEFDFIATTNNIGVNYVFGSEEYDEFVCSQYNDVFAFFISGPNPAGGNYDNENLAVIGTTMVPVAINNVNNGHPTDTDCIPQNTSLFVSNPDGSAEIQYDGFTVVFNASANIEVGEEYHFKIAIADASDSSLDSGVFIEGQSFTTYVCDPGVLSINTDQEYCVGEVPLINVSTSSGLPSEYAFVVTNDADEIQEILYYPSNQVDLSAYSYGDYKIYGVSWDGTINGLAVGQNLLNLSMEEDEECFDVSNPIIISLLDCFVPNPDLDVECGDLDVVFVIDESGSIENDPDDVDDVKDGVLVVANALLNSGANLNIIEFDTEATLIDLDGTLVNDDLIDNLDDYLNSNYGGQSYSPGGWTNWEDALNEVEALDGVELVIFFTDGNPTAYNDGGGVTSGNDAGIMAIALDKAITAANEVKDQGKHVFMVGVGEVNSSNLPLISDTDLYNPPAVDIFTGDYTVESYESLAGCLEQTILDICGTDLEISKTVDYDGCYGSTAVFTVEVTNTGNPNGLAALNVVISDLVPDGYSNVQLLGGPIDGLVLVGSEFTYSLDELAVGETVSFSFSTDVNDVGDYLNVATVDASNSAEQSAEVGVDPQVCCELIVECPDANGGNYDCIDDVPAGSADLITIVDSCNDPIITYNDEAEGDGCPDSPMVITRTYTIIDGDESASCVQTFTVIDNIPPVLSNVPSDVTIDCEDDLPTDLPDTDDNCDPNPTLEVDLIYPPVSFTSDDDECQLRTQTQGGWGSPANGNNPGVYRDANFDGAFPSGLVVGCDDYTLTLTSAAAVQNFLPSGGTPNPLVADLVDPDGYNVFGGQIVALALSLGFDAYDADFGDSDTPLADLVFNSGTFEGWTVGELFELANAVFGGCSDDYSPSAVSDALATVNENFVGGDIDLGNLDCPGEENICEYDVIRLFTLTDNCMNVAQAQQVITIADNDAPVLSNLPDDVTINCGDALPPVADVEIEDNCDSNPSLTFTEEEVPVDNCVYEVWRHWYGEDECDNQASHVQVITITDLDDPVLHGIPDDQEISCLDEIPGPADVTATDNCDLDMIVSYVQQDDYSQCPYTITRIWSVEDDCGNSATGTQVITIVDDIPPVIEDVDAYVAIECDDMSGLSIEASDDCSEVIITYEDLQYSGGGCYGVFERTWYATDACGNVSSTTQVIELNDETAPVFIGLGTDMTIECDESYEVPEVTAIDNCVGPVPVTFHEDVEPGDCPAEMLITWTWAAEDECGNENVAIQVLSIVDTTPPVIGLEDGDFEIPCDEYPPLPDVLPTDNCSDSEDIIFNMVETLDPGTCGGQWVITRTYSAEDECGNMAGVVQTFYGIDDLPPVFVSHGADVTIECDDEIPAPEYEVEDNCSEIIEVVPTDVIVPTNCPSEYTIIRTYVATDECDNSSSIEQVITVVDETAPEFVDTPGDINLNCGDEIPGPIELEATDNCEGAVEITVETSYAGDVPDEDALTYCAGEDPIGQDDPEWSFVMFETPTGTEYYTTVDAHWVTYADEGEGQTAHLYGSVVSSSNPDAGWDFDVWFYNGEGWDEWISEPWENWYKNDPDNAGLNYLDWMYYLTNADESSMTGWGDLEGSWADLSHLPGNNYFGFQEGFAANNTTDCYGVGGWLHYEGYLVDAFNDIEEEISGGSDFSFCLDCCPEYQVIYTWTAEDCAGNTAIHTQTITIDGTEALANAPASGACIADFNQNGEVDIVDFLMLSSEFGCQGQGCQCDLDGNGHVNTVDLLMFSSLFGLQCE